MTKILFVAAHDWLFAQRHLPAVRAARELDLEVVVAAKSWGHARSILAAGARFVSLEAQPKGLSPIALVRSATALKALIATESPAIVQMHGIGPVMAGAVAARLGATGKHVFAFNGLGALGHRTDVLAQAGLGLARSLLGPLTAPESLLLFDNPDDAAVLGFDPTGISQPGRPTVRILPGSGVDPLIHSPEPMQWSPPLKLVFGSTLLWSNGPDLAVEAVSKARKAGADVTLSLIGRACQPGHAAVPEATLNSWSRMPGINWYAPASDLAQIWRQHHMLILPSRGGDGLPLLMTEAASAGRAILTTDVAGCGSFVREGIDGLVVPKDDVSALGEAVAQLARTPGLVERMGRSAREHVLEGYTERHVMDDYKRLWLQMLQNQVLV